jgi:hypothetical protein
MKTATRVLCSLLLAANGYAMSFADSGENVRQQHDDMKKFFEAMGQQPRTESFAQRARAAAEMKNAPKIDQAFWDEAAGSPARTNTGLQTASELAKMGVATFGTAAQAEMIAQLQTWAGQMLRTNSPQLQQAGKDMQHEADALSAGDRADAEASANAIQNIPMLNLDGYTPTQQDNMFANAAKAAVAHIAGAIITAVGTVVGAIIGAYLSWGSGTAYGAALGGSLGNVLGNAIGGAVQGQDVDTAGQAADVGAGVMSDAARFATDRVQQAADHRVNSALNDPNMGANGGNGGTGGGDVNQSGSSAPAVNINPSAAGSAEGNVLPGAQKK